MKTCFSLLAVSLSMIAALTSSTSSATTIKVEHDYGNVNATVFDGDYYNSPDQVLGPDHTITLLVGDQYITLSLSDLMADPNDPTEIVALDPQEFNEDIPLVLFEDLSSFGSDQDGDIPLIVPSVPDRGSTLMCLAGASFLLIFLKSKLA